MQEEMKKPEVVGVRRRPVAELLDLKEPYTFFVPDYQRGYRWKAQQVQELLEDLLTFAIKEQNTDNYYCLQPLVVRNDEDNNRIEVIDGQQRLTTLKIILHFIKQKMGDEDWGLLGVGNYSITYATREKTNGFIESLNPDNADIILDNEPIDFFHMRRAYITVRDWFYSKNAFDGKGARELCDRLGAAKDAGIRLIKDLLVRTPVGNNPTAQFLWYEIGKDDSSIRLFNRLNTGKLELTDAELIKALFLLRTNFSGDIALQEQEQFRQAINWERMENALHNDAFWRFITPRHSYYPNRIDLLLELVYRNRLADKLHSEGLQEKDISKKIEEEIKKKHAIFNHYNELFNVPREHRYAIIHKEWRRIDDTFSILEDWFSDPIIYNLVGFLCHTKVAMLQDLYAHYLTLKGNIGKSRQDFVDHLKSLITDSLKDIQICERNGAGEQVKYEIDLAYGDQDVFKLLLLLNLDHLNRRAIDRNLKSGELETCKFPFAILDDMWDIEHVDSRTENDLSNATDRQKWLEAAERDLADVMTKVQRAEVERLKDSDDPEREQKLVRYLRRDVAKEEGSDEEAKDNISNLVLLDAETNRSYKNGLFITKRKKIIERREGGQYVPETTSYVFFKLFEGSAHLRWQWTADDMQCYANYIVQQLKEYLPPAKGAI